MTDPAVIFEAFRLRKDRQGSLGPSDLVDEKEVGMRRPPLHVHVEGFLDIRKNLASHSARKAHLKN